jgi:hypothetical protein
MFVLGKMEKEIKLEGLGDCLGRKKHLANSESLPVWGFVFA